MPLRTALIICLTFLLMGCGGSKSGPPRPYEFADVVVPLELRAAYDEIASMPRFDNVLMTDVFAKGILHRRALAYIRAYDLFLLEQDGLDQVDSLSLFFLTDYSSGSLAITRELAEQLAFEHGFQPAAVAGFPSFFPDLNTVLFRLRKSPLVPKSLGDLVTEADRLLLEHSDTLAFAFPAGLPRPGGHGQGGGGVF